MPAKAVHRTWDERVPVIHFPEFIVEDFPRAQGVVLDEQPQGARNVVVGAVGRHLTVGVGGSATGPAPSAKLDTVVIPESSREAVFSGKSGDPQRPPLPFRSVAEFNVGFQCAGARPPPPIEDCESNSSTASSRTAAGDLGFRGRVCGRQLVGFLNFRDPKLEKQFLYFFFSNGRLSEVFCLLGGAALTVITFIRSDLWKDNQLFTIFISLAAALWWACLVALICLRRVYVRSANTSTERETQFEELQPSLTDEKSNGFSSAPRAGRSHDSEQQQQVQRSSRIVTRRATALPSSIDVSRYVALRELVLVLANATSYVYGLSNVLYVCKEDQVCKPDLFQQTEALLLLPALLAMVMCPVRIVVLLPVSVLACAVYFGIKWIPGVNYYIQTRQYFPSLSIILAELGTGLFLCAVRETRRRQLFHTHVERALRATEMETLQEKARALAQAQIPEELLALRRRQSAQLMTLSSGTMAPDSPTRAEGGAFPVDLSAALLGSKLRESANALVCDLRCVGLPALLSRRGPRAMVSVYRRLEALWDSTVEGALEQTGLSRVLRVRKLHTLGDGLRLVAFPVSTASVTTKQRSDSRSGGAVTLAAGIVPLAQNRRSDGGSSGRGGGCTTRPQIRARWVALCCHLSDVTTAALASDALQTEMFDTGLVPIQGPRERTQSRSKSRGSSAGGDSSNVTNDAVVVVVVAASCGRASFSVLPVTQNWVGDGAAVQACSDMHHLADAGVLLMARRHCRDTQRRVASSLLHAESSGDDVVGLGNNSALGESRGVLLLSESLYAESGGCRYEEATGEADLSSEVDCAQRYRESQMGSSILRDTEDQTSLPLWFCEALKGVPHFFPAAAADILHVSSFAKRGRGGGGQGTPQTAHGSLELSLSSSLLPPPLLPPSLMTPPRAARRLARFRMLVAVYSGSRASAAVRGPGRRVVTAANDDSSTMDVHRHPGSSSPLVGRGLSGASLHSDSVTSYSAEVLGDSSASSGQVGQPLQAIVASSSSSATGADTASGRDPRVTLLLSLPHSTHQDRSGHAGVVSGISSKEGGAVAGENSRMPETTSAGDQRELFRRGSVPIAMDAPLSSSSSNPFHAPQSSIAADEADADQGEEKEERGGSDARLRANERVRLVEVPQSWGAELCCPPAVSSFLPALEYRFAVASTERDFRKWLSWIRYWPTHGFRGFWLVTLGSAIAMVLSLIINGDTQVVVATDMSTNEGPRGGEGVGDGHLYRLPMVWALASVAAALASRVPLVAGWISDKHHSFEGNAAAEEEVVVVGEPIVVHSTVVKVAVLALLHVSQLCYLLAVFLAADGTMLRTSQIAWECATISWTLQRPLLGSIWVMWSVDLFVHVSFLLREFLWVRTGFASEIILPFACIVACLGFWVALEHSLREEFATAQQIVFLKEEIEHEMKSLREALLCIVPSGVVGRILLHFRHTQAERLQAMTAYAAQEERHRGVVWRSGGGSTNAAPTTSGTTMIGDVAMDDAGGADDVGGVGQLDDMEIDIDDMPFALIGVSRCCALLGDDMTGDSSSTSSSSAALIAQLLLLFCESGIAAEFGNRVQVIQSSNEFLLLAGLSQDDGTDEHDERRAADVFRATSRLLSAAAAAAAAAENYFLDTSGTVSAHRDTVVNPESTGVHPPSVSSAATVTSLAPLEPSPEPRRVSRRRGSGGGKENDSVAEIGNGTMKCVVGGTGANSGISFRVVLDTSPMLGALIGTHTVRFSCFGEAVFSSLALAATRSWNGSSNPSNHPFATASPPGYPGSTCLLGDNETAISRSFERCLALNLPVQVALALADEEKDAELSGGTALSTRLVCCAVQHVDPGQQIFDNQSHPKPVVVRCRPTFGHPRSYVVAHQALHVSARER